MFSHVMIGSNDIERSKQFYDAVLGVLGAGEPVRNQNGTGQVRLFYRHDGGTFCVSEPLNGESASSAVRQSRCSSSTMWLWRMEAFPSKSRRGCVRARWEPCTCPMCAIRTATSFARFTGPSRVGCATGAASGPLGSNVDLYALTERVGLLEIRLARISRGCAPALRAS